MVLLSASLASAQDYVIEPDDYADGTALNNINPKVELAIYANLDSFPEDFGEFPTPSIIPVTALENEDIFGGYFTSTGTHSFGHAGVGFNSSSRALGMRFLEPAAAVRIDAIGSSNLSDTVGVLDVFDTNGVLLESVETVLLGRQEVGTLSISRDQADIGYARAYSSEANEDYSPFGRFDNLRFSTVPGSILIDFCDVNRDGLVGFADIPPFIANFSCLSPFSICVLRRLKLCKIVSSSSFQKSLRSDCLGSTIRVMNNSESVFSSRE